MSRRVDVVVENDCCEKGRRDITLLSISTKTRLSSEASSC